MTKVAMIQIQQSRLDARVLSWLVLEVDRMIAEDPTAIVLDLARVEYIDSLGVGVLAHAKRRAGKRKIALAGPNSFVMSVVRAAHLADQFEILSSADAARDLLAG